ncbi:hypothetical protein FE257_008617 [Aspergillus nanangensis]|uniref:Nephrocystin 3-like N-terminal domain-containing protein n=1 Tax=Aspergillus nanangensis TaxID=2582783 RepID=A0AAD4CL34_ASPNN|nr:hypothetical protein FE257_008617 [Aspergillus nanangensis]
MAGLETEVVEIESLLQKLLSGIVKIKSKARKTVISRHLRLFRMQISFSDLEELVEALQRRKTSLILAVDVENLGMFVSFGVGMLPRMAHVSSKRCHTDSNTGIDASSRMTAREFLNSLDAPNYVDDRFRIREPFKGTASWIYDRTEYVEWLGTNQPLSILHLIGKMGCGKSVLMKSIIQRLQNQTRKPARCGSAVLYYFCIAVNRIDTPVSIVKGFISQLVLGYEGLFDDAVDDIEVLNIQQTPDLPNWSFETLLDILTTLIQHCHFSSLYCAVDALDESEQTGLGELLKCLLHLTIDHSPSETKTRLLFSSRAHSHLLTLLDDDHACFRIFARPKIVPPDIRISIQDGLAKLSQLLALDDKEAEGLQGGLVEKSDGMFLWALLALKEITTNCYGVTKTSIASSRIYPLG